MGIWGTPALPYLLLLLLPAHLWNNLSLSWIIFLFPATVPASLPHKLACSSVQASRELFRSPHFLPFTALVALSSTLGTVVPSIFYQ